MDRILSCPFRIYLWSSSSSSDPSVIILEEISWAANNDNQPTKKTQKTITKKHCKKSEEPAKGKLALTDCKSDPQLFRWGSYFDGTTISFEILRMQNKIGFPFFCSFCFSSNCWFSETKEQNTYHIFSLSLSVTLFYFSFFPALSFYQKHIFFYLLKTQWETKPVITRATLKVGQRTSLMILGHLQAGPQWPPL